ncbi:MAG TPA: GGDEF domain-containing protein [Actinophytocola sp.]|uniref:GGDEF domain-containing protein n=1 Tax=Actinophytocola sp. TaxID=1872138 RepID=UPI002DBDD37E|nr:GGDEF domain-containing protein [Actinophytocola sp.]HEU5470387.1 GGDEF domain-containing protein [Actinophytocola sp.]
MRCVAGVPGVSFAFQPLLSTRTGHAVAVEALARPHSGTVYDLLIEAGQQGQLTSADVALATSAMLAGTEPGHRLPLHINLLASTAARGEQLMRYFDAALTQAGRSPDEITLEITPPFCRVPRPDLVHGLEALRRQGFRIAFDAVGQGDLPLTLLMDLRPDLIKIDPRLLAGVPGDAVATALVESVAGLAMRMGLHVAAVGVENPDQLTTVCRLGIRFAQGNLIAAPAAHPTSSVRLPAEAIAATDPDPTPVLTELLRTALTLPESATIEQVRDVLVRNKEAGSVVLLDQDYRPRAMVDRNRFLLAVGGPHGHIQHAKRPVLRQADPPRLVRGDASALELLELFGTADRDRTGDDVVVVDDAGRCAGVVRLAEMVRVVAATKVERAAAVNPITGLPGSDQMVKEIERRIARGTMFVVAWLDVDSFRTVNDTVGLAAGDELIRAIGGALAEAAAGMPGIRVGHVGGDNFLAVTDLDEIAALAEQLVDPLWTVAGISVSVSLAALVCTADAVRSYRDAARLLAPLKKQAKAVPGSSWVLGRPGSDRVEVLRGRARVPRAVS